MSAVALALVLLSAVVHATWNLLAKRARGGLAFTWLFDSLSVLLYMPVFAIAAALQPPRLDALAFGLMLGSAVLHLGYFLVLMRGYQVGDLSLVYPLARGLGPMLSTATAVVLLGERPTPLALAGAVLIGLGVVGLTGDPRALRRSGTGRSVLYAAITGVLIASYTLWDKYAVGTSGAAIPPIVYFWGFTTLRALMLTPLALRRWPEVRAGWSNHRREALGIALLSPLSYILVLVALVVSPVSYVAPAREIGILFGVAMGSRLLAEGDAGRRLAAAGAMMLGVIALAVG